MVSEDWKRDPMMMESAQKAFKKTVTTPRSLGDPFLRWKHHREAWDIIPDSSFLEKAVSVAGKTMLFNLLEPPAEDSGAWIFTIWSMAFKIPV